MPISKSLIAKLKRKLPELCSVSDLIKIGVYRSEQAAYSGRKTGKCPPHFRLPFRGIVYPRDGVIEFLMLNANKTDMLEPTVHALISHPGGSRIAQNQKVIPR